MSDNEEQENLSRDLKDKYLNNEEKEVNNTGRDEKLKESGKVIKISFEQLSQTPDENERIIDPIKQKMISDVEETLRRMGIDPSSADDIDESDTTYIRNDPIYREVGNYILGELLGEGKFGQVKGVVHKKTCQRFAAKIIDKHSIARKGQNYVINIELEINLVTKLNHKYVMRTVDTFSIGSLVYLISEYGFGCLEEFIDPLKKLPKSQSHWYFCQLIEGLEYIHSQGIIHRDIKPANILISNSNDIKIADFGVCYELNPFETNDLIASAEGTPLFQPPEVHDENMDKYSGTKFDIWSSGVTLFNMITAKFPFDSDNFFEAILKEEVKYPEEISQDKQLMDLLQNIFIKDFTNRITINKIKDHSDESFEQKKSVYLSNNSSVLSRWFIIKHSSDDFISLPPQPSRDLYRSLSVLPSIQNHYFPMSRDPNKLVDYEEFKESCDRTPNVRSNRLKSKRCAYRRKKSPTIRLVRLGLQTK